MAKGGFWVRFRRQFLLLHSDGVGATPVAEIGDLKVPHDDYAFAKTPEEQDIGFGVRPEDVHLEPPACASPPVTGTLALIDPMGADTLCWFDIGPQLLSVRLEPARARSLAGQHQLYFDMRKVSLFSAATERRL